VIPIRHEHVVVVGDIYALAGRADELDELLQETQEHARSEPGCVAYAFAEVVRDPGHYVIAQEWRDEAALEAHYASPAFRRYQDRIGEFLARPSEVRLHRVAQTVQLADPGPMDPRRAD
jgi:quinol monooxygenase YgiN